MSGTNRLHASLSMSPHPSKISPPNLCGCTGQYARSVPHLALDLLPVAPRSSPILHQVFQLMSPAGRFPVHPYRPKLYVCTFPFCNKSCRTKGGLKQHARLHRQHGHNQAPTLERHSSEASDRGSHDLEFPGSELADQPNRHGIRFHPVLDGMCPHSTASSYAY